MRNGRNIYSTDTKQSAILFFSSICIAGLATENMEESTAPMLVAPSRETAE